jgi:uncharacterized protein (DUF608 family)
MPGILKSKPFFLCILLLASVLHAFTINGASAPARLLGVPIGGIGAGVFNFLPNGSYSRDYCQTKPATGLEPTIMAYASSGSSKWSAQSLTTAAGMGISYTGYWPKVINTYTNASMSIRLTLEAFSPIYPGGNKDGSLPLAFFVFKLENPTAAPVTASIALRNSATTSVIMDGAAVKGIAGNNITMEVKNDSAAQVTSGGDIADFTADGLLSNAAGGILASQVVVQPSRTRTITFVLAWDNITNGYYRKFFQTSRDIADYGYANVGALKAKVDNWQGKILSSNFPDWYKDILINNCHVLNSMYEWRNDGYCAQTESMSDGGMPGCFDQRYYASVIVPLFAPDAEYQEMKEFATSQTADGQITHSAFGGEASRGPKSDINPEYVLCLLRDYMWTGESRFLDMYTNAKKALSRQRAWDADKDGLVDGTYTTWDQMSWDGWTPQEDEYPCELELAGFKAGEKLATISGDAAMADSCRAWYAQTSATFEKPDGQHGFWDNTAAGPTGLKGYYTGSNDLVSNGAKGKACWTSQFPGMVYADMLQLGQLHPQARVDSAIQFIEALCKGARGYYIAIMPDRSTWFGKQPGGNTAGEQWPWYPPAQFGPPAIAQGFADIGLDCVYRQWLSNYSGGPVAPLVWNSPLAMMIDGNYASAGWGDGRYMNPSGAFLTLFSLTGFTIDIANKKLWVKPNVPTSMNGKLVKAPLINSNSCGTLDYTASPPAYGQDLTIAFDSTLRFSAITLRDQNAAIAPVYVSVTNTGGTVPCTFSHQGSGRQAEIVISFPTDCAIDKNGISIKVSASPVALAMRDFAGIRKSGAPLIQKSVYGMRKLRPRTGTEVYDIRRRLIGDPASGRLRNADKRQCARGIVIYKPGELQ